MSAPTQTLTDRVKQSFFANGKGKALTEEALAERFGVSRGAVREVLVTLEKSGLIERRRRAGTRLREPSVKDLVDLWDMRCALESMAARLASANTTPADTRKLRDWCQARCQAAEAGDHAGADRADIAFHQHIVDLSDNGCIRDTMAHTHLYDRIFLINYTTSSYWPDDENAPYSHQGIISALEAGDGAVSAERMAQHIQLAKKRRVEALIGRINPFD